MIITPVPRNITHIVRLKKIEYIFIGQIITVLQEIIQSKRKMFRLGVY